MRREATTKLMADHAVSERRACRVVGLCRGTQRYHAKRSEPNGMRQRLRAHAAAHRRWGYKKMTTLLRRDGFAVNHKRVYRMYRQEKLLVHQRRRRRRCAALIRVQPEKATRPNQQWAMDFMSDALSTGRRFRLFTLVDHFTHQGLALKAAFCSRCQRIELFTNSTSWSKNMGCPR
jgi:putative transposase